MARKRPTPRTPTAEDNAFLRDILAAPEDDAPRLRYADWLMANGDPERAEYIRLDIRQTRSTGETAATRSRRGNRLRELWAAHREAWLEVLPVPMRGFVSFVRGFPGRADCDIVEFLDWPEPLWQAAPVTGLITTLCLRTEELYSGDLEAMAAFRKLIGPRVQELAAAPQLARILDLDMNESGIRTRHVKPLVGSRFLTRLRSLDLSVNGLGNEAAEAVAGSSRFPNLAVLRMDWNQIGDPGARALANSPHLASLAELSLSNNVIGDEGGQALAKSPHLKNLRRLDLTKNNLSKTVRAALRERFRRRVVL
jgi:uncharacterized protein (TIGR02996 family)